MSTGKTYSTKYLLDSNNNRGAEGQILSTTSTGIDWVDANTVPGTGLWLASGNDIYNSNSGNVGIGTTSPGAKLHVASSSPIIQTQDTDGTNQIGRMYQLNSDLVLSSRNNTSRGSFSLQSSNGTDTVERMRIDSSGNVGIGTNSPYTGAITGRRVLHINGTSSALLALGVGNALSYLYHDGSNLQITNLAAAGGDIIIQNNGAERMRIDSSGNVGIGTAGPGAKLHVYSATGRSFEVDQSTPNITVLKNDYALELLSGNGYDLKLNANGSSTYGNITFITNSSEKMRVTSAGNVGIGTTSPARKLSVENSSSSIIADFKYSAAAYSSIDLSNNVSFARLSSVNSDLLLSPAGVEKMRVTSSGNVGIGTSTPNAKLDIQGTQGQLFSVTDDLSGEIFAVADISGVPIMTVNSSGVSYFDGKVGIGTSTPSALLHVKGGDGVTGVIKVEGGNNNVAAEGEINSQIDFGSNDASVWSSGNIGGRIASVTEATNGALVGMAFSTFKQGTASPDLLSEKVRIRNNGDVGIGTPSPGAKLDVNGAANIKGTANFAPVLTLGTAGAINAVINSADEMFFNIDSDNNQTNAAFWFGHNSTQGNTASNLMIIKDNGRVGIGITNPAVPLDVEGKIRSNDSNSGDYLEIFCDGSVSGYNYITTSANDLLVAPQSGGLLVQGENYGSGFDGRIQVYNALNAAVKVKLHSNGDSYLNGGNVGINQSAPLTRLDIIGSLGSGSTAQQSNIKTATPSAGSTAVFRNGGNSSITIQGDNQVSSNTFASLNFGIWSDMTDGQIIYSFQDQFMSFSTANSEKLRIESGGEVGINTISPSATLHLKAIASNGVPFKLEGHPSTTVEQMLIITSKAFNSSDAWYNLVTQAGDGAGGATNTCIIERDGDLRNKNNSYGQISDSRLKENITDATPKLDDVMKVKVKNFNFIGEDLKQIGVVAQELEEVFPGLVKEDKQPDVNGKEGGIYKSVKYSVLVPILLKAMQEQQDQIEDLKTRITQLEN